MRLGDEKPSENKTIAGSQFEKHFDKPPMPANCVVDFRMPEGENGCESGQSHESLLKQEVVNFISACQRASNSSNRGHQPVGRSGNVWTICVWGAGGMGKSVALQALCRDEDVMRYFEDGIHFMTLGMDANVKGMITQLGLCVGNAGYESLEREVVEMSSGSEAAKKCSKVLKGKRVLLIADDIWGREGNEIGFLREIQSFGSQMDGGMVIVSSRDETIARAVDREVHFDYLEARGSSSVRILRAPLDELGWDGNAFENLQKKEREELNRLLDLCGGWKLCLAVAASGLAEDVRDHGENVGLGVRMYIEKLEEDKMMLSCEGMEEYGDLVTVTRSSLRRCEEWGNKGSIRRVREGDLSIDEMFRGLCVIERQKWMGVSTVLKQFARRNLVSRRRVRMGGGRNKESSNKIEGVGAVN